MSSGDYEISDMSENTASRPVPRKVFVVGLDGGTFDLLDRWMDQGALPNLRAMVETGVSGELESTIPPMTAAAWTSFMTGKNPGRHAIYDFGTQDKTSYRYRPINARFRRGACVWDLIGAEGARVVVLNVPTTYPPHPVNGALIGDFLTPTGARDFVYPPGLLEELEGRFGKYPLHPFPPYFVATNADSDFSLFLTQYKQAMVQQFRVAHYLIDKLGPHFLMLHIYGNDQICHWLWHLLDESHPQYQKGLSERHLPAILDYYREFDAQVGRLAAAGDDDTTLLVLSDHGFGPLHKVINLNTWLMQEGYLVLRKRPVTRLRRLLWKAGFTPEGLAKRQWIRSTVGRLIMRTLKEPNLEKLMALHSRGELLLSLGDVDWAKTRAFCLFGWGQVKINVRGRYPQGCVAPGEEYERLRSELVHKLRTLKDPQTGEPVDGEVFTRDDVYNGPFLEEAPDITFLPMKKHYWANSRGTGFSSNAVFSTYLWGMTGMHTMNGILVAQGKHFRRGVRLKGARIVDLFPSMLYLMGIQIPGDLDGRPLQDLFTPDFLEQNPLAVSHGTDLPTFDSAQLSPEQEQDVLQRLKDLGYL